jgi:hypothetical protein
MSPQKKYENVNNVFMQGVLPTTFIVLLIVHIGKKIL